MCVALSCLIHHKGSEPNLRLCFDHLCVQRKNTNLCVSHYHQSKHILLFHSHSQHGYFGKSLPRDTWRGTGIHTETILLFSLLTGHSLQCYTCRDLTSVDKCLTVENCTKEETMCKTTMYSLEDGEDNSFFIHAFNRNQRLTVLERFFFPLTCRKELCWELQLSCWCGKQCLYEGIINECSELRF